MKDYRTIILKPLVTERGYSLVERNNAYSFEVAPTANKIEIKEAVEKLFSVHVQKVRTMVRMGKIRGRGRGRRGRTKHWKKAIVTLAQDDRIDIY